MTGIILPPNLPPEVTREIALAVLAAGPGVQDQAVREVVRCHTDSVHRAWEDSVGLAMRSLRGTGVWDYYDRDKVWALIDLSFGTVPETILQSVCLARRKREERDDERRRRAKNFDGSISGRPPGKVRERLFYTPAIDAFNRAKRGQL